MGRRRLRLSAGSPPGCAIIALPAVAFLGLIEAFMLWIAVDQTRRFVTGGDFGPGTVLLFILLMVILAMLLYVLGAMALVYLGMARHRVWLKGPFLVERRIALRRRVDLRSARLDLHPNSRDARLSLTATDPRTGKSLELPIQQLGRTLPPAELTALADAILDEPGVARRAGPDQVTAMTVANRLRELTTGGPV